MTSKQYMLCAALGSGLLLMSAFAFQHLAGMAPCNLCIWQRYPHAVAVFAGGLALVWNSPFPLFTGALSALTTAGIGAYHVGVEQKWWDGPSTCSAGPIGSLSTDDLMDQIMAAPLVRCDEIPWELFGVSMAGWNALASLGLLFFWLMALRRS